MTGPYSLKETSTPNVLYRGEQPLFVLAWPGVQAPAPYETREIARLMVKLLNADWIAERTPAASSTGTPSDAGGSRPTDPPPEGSGLVEALRGLLDHIDGRPGLSGQPGMRPAYQKACAALSAHDKAKHPTQD